MASELYVDPTDSDFDKVNYETVLTPHKKLLSQSVTLSEGIRIL